MRFVELFSYLGHPNGPIFFQIELFFFAFWSGVIVTIFWLFFFSFFVIPDSQSISMDVIGEHF